MTKRSIDDPQPKRFPVPPRHRILEIIASLEPSSAARQLTLLATSLPRDEFDIHVCVLGGKGANQQALVDAGIAVTHLGQRFSLDPRMYLALERFIRRLKPDLTHTWIGPANVYGHIAARRAGVRRIVASARRADPKAPWWRRSLERRLDHGTDAFVVQSESLRDFYVRLGLPEAKLRLIHDGIALPAAYEASRAEPLTEFDIPASARLIGVVDDLVASSRLKDAIWTTDMIKIILDNVHLAIVGEGPERLRLTRYRNCCRLFDEVHFLGARDDWPQLMSHFDFLWAPNPLEHAREAILAAMAAGKPVVAANSAASRELVRPGETGYLVPPGDRAALGRYAVKILEDAELARRLGAAGRATVEKEYGEEASVEGYAALYRELLDGGSDVGARRDDLVFAR